MALVGELGVNGNKMVALDIHGIQQEWQGEEGLVPSCSRQGEVSEIHLDPSVLCPEELGRSRGTGEEGDSQWLVHPGASAWPGPSADPSGLQEHPGLGSLDVAGCRSS